jgi:hypothetical protein
MMKRMIRRLRQAFIWFGGWVKKILPSVLFVLGWFAITAGVAQTWRGWAISAGSFLLLQVVTRAFSLAARERREQAQKRP